MATGQTWFKPLRKSYIAANYKGALSYIPFVAYLVVSAIIPFDEIKPRSVAIFIVLPNWVIAGIIMTVFARSKSS